MRIPGGDLVPARHRRYGGGYGRRRRRNRLVLAVIVLLGLAAGGGWYLRRDNPSTPTTVTTLPSCSAQPSPSASTTSRPTAPVVLPPPGAVTLSVLNGTNRALLAKHVADQLAALGFHVTGQGNARTTVAGPSQVVYGPGASLPARRASSWVLGSQAVPAPSAARGSVQVVLGSTFTRLATPAEAAARARQAPAPSSAPSATPSVLPCRT
ncbi:MAG: LytR cell envelope-related transcriptional attenuator [Frankiales bacterium]|nr:LytR cell envelope-related transcriptional attenuator [Frankiales bacterium]